MLEEIGLIFILQWSSKRRDKKIMIDIDIGYGSRKMQHLRIMIRLICLPWWYWIGHLINNWMSIIWVNVVMRPSGTKVENRRCRKCMSLKNVLARCWWMIKSTMGMLKLIPCRIGCGYLGFLQRCFVKRTWCDMCCRDRCCCLERCTLLSMKNCNMR